MMIPVKALKNGFTMPSQGMGTWMTNIGRKPRPSLGDEKRIQEIVTALENGISYIDTAERYANGYMETLIGMAIKGYNREKLFLSSKVSSDNLDYDSIILSAKGSLKRLKTTYLDLYLVHMFNPSASLKETMRALDFLVEKKLIKHIGVCDFTPEQMQEAQSYSQNNIVVNQLHYNLAFRKAEKEEIVSYCQKNNIMIIAWRPYEETSLSSKTKALLEKLAAKYKKTKSQIATNWLMAQENIVVLSKLNTSNKIKETENALDIKMTKADLDLLTNENH